MNDKERERLRQSHANLRALRAANRGEAERIRQQRALENALLDVQAQNGPNGAASDEWEGE